MAIFVATFTATAVSAAQDVFEIVAPSASRIRIHDCVLGQYSDAGDAAAELLSVIVQRGYTTTGSGGSTLSPVNLSGLPGAAATVTTVKSNNTSVATGGTAATIRAETWNVQGPWFYNPDSNAVLEIGQRLVIRITAPADSLTMNGTLTYEEIGNV